MFRQFTKKKLQQIVIVLLLQNQFQFHGIYCEIDLSICEETFPCQNNGSCILDSKNVTGTGFICTCPPGFTGHQCEIDISVCNATENVCQNGGKCVDGIGNKFRCLCEPGWSGDTCHIEIDECESQPCLNGGICVNKINDFSCACPFGYSGRACETKLQICEENPCLNGAFCLNEEDDATKKTCWCVPDFHGVLCEYRYDDCNPAPKCFNGGTCIDGVGEFTCSCPPDVFGPACQCTAENATEPECSIYANGTLPTTPDYPGSAIMPTVSFIPSSTIQVSPSKSIEVLHSSEMLSLESEIRSPSIPFSSPYDPGGGAEGRGDGVGATALFPSDVIGVTSGFIAPTETLVLSPSPYSHTTIYEPLTILPSESILSPDVSSSVRLDGSEDTLSIAPQTTLLSTSLPTDEESSRITPFLQSSTLLSQIPDYDSSDNAIVPLETSKIDLGVTPTVDVVSTAPIEGSHDLHTADLTVGFPPLSVRPSPEADLVDPTESFISSMSTAAIDQQISLTAGVIPPLHGSISMKHQSDILATPTTSLELPPLSSAQIFPSESIFYADVSKSIHFADSTAAIPDATTGISVITSELQGELPEPTPAMAHSTSIYDGDFGSAFTPIISATPTVDLPMASTSPFPFTTLQPNTTDPCKNYCQNNAKCIADTIEPICLCSFKFTGNQCEIPTEKFRAASFTGDSFLSYRVPNESIISKVDIRSKMVTIVPEGILLYTGVGRMYALIFTQNGHVTLHFSCGSQSMHFVETRTRVDNGFNFTLEFRMEMIVQGVSQLRCSAEVSVNQSYVMKGEQVVGRDGVIRTAADKPIETVFLGGIPPFHTYASLNDDIVGILPGFRGCLHFLMVNQEQQDIYDDALDGKEVLECSSFGCVANPCHGSAICTTTRVYPFWACKCPHGYKGRRCQIIVCSNNPCKNGATCTYSQEALNLISNSAEEDGLLEDILATSTTVAPVDKKLLQPICLCLLGFSGSVCQHKINVTKPAFQPISGYSSFIAYDPIPRFIDWFQLKFYFVTKNISQISLLLYSGNNRGPQPLFLHNTNNPHSHDHLDFLTSTSAPLSTDNQNKHMQISGFDQTLADAHPEPASDFFAITFLQGFVALTWNLGSGTQRITTPSRVDNRLNIHTLFAGRSGRQAWLKVDGMRNVTGKTPGPLYRLNSDSNELYIGGYKTYKFEGLSHDLPLHQGFQGCIFDVGFRVRNRLYLPRAINGRNVKNCFEEDC